MAYTAWTLEIEKDRSIETVERTVDCKMSDILYLVTPMVALAVDG